MMSLKPRNVDFQDTWSKLKDTVSSVVRLQGVERGVWNARFSDVYALCVAQPEPLADRLYDETRAFLEAHVAALAERVRAAPPAALLAAYVAVWREFSQGLAYLNNLYSYLNLQHVRRQKVPDADLVYGAAAGVAEPEARQLEVGELGLLVWERQLVEPLAPLLSPRIVSALCAARHTPPDPLSAALLKDAIASFVATCAYRAREPFALYSRLVLTPYLEVASEQHARLAAELVAAGDMSAFMRAAREGLARELRLAGEYLPPESADDTRRSFECAAVSAHLDALHAHAAPLVRAATDSGAPAELRTARQDDLRNMFVLLRPIQGALRPLVDAAYEQVVREGTALLAASTGREDPAALFVRSVVSLHARYSELFADVFESTQAFVSALDKACSVVVNARAEGESRCAAPELLARYCDTLLRRRPAAAPCDQDVDERLSAAILVFKYVDDKDVFQKYYARALARRLIHQLAASMELEEAMIERLKAACGYEFTNKLHRMFTDVTLSADLNAKFQNHLREAGDSLGVGFSVQVLQAGAWPLGGAPAAAAGGCVAALERPTQLFDAFYRKAFNGRRLAWLAHLCTGELRTRYTPRPHLVTASAHQCALLLCFEACDSASAARLRDELQLTAEQWPRHVRPLLDAGLLLASGDVGLEPDSAEAPAGDLALNLAFTSKRTKIRVTCAAAPEGARGGAAGASGARGEAGAESAHCDDDRKMYLQAAIVRIMKQRRVARHAELVQEAVAAARGSFAPPVHLVKKCIEALIDKQYLERAPGTTDTYSYLA